MLLNWNTGHNFLYSQENEKNKKKAQFKERNLQWNNFIRSRDRVRLLYENYKET